MIPAKDDKSGCVICEGIGSRHCSVSQPLCFSLEKLNGLDKLSEVALDGEVFRVMEVRLDGTDEEVWQLFGDVHADEIDLALAGDDAITAGLLFIPFKEAALINVGEI